MGSLTKIRLSDLVPVLEILEQRGVEAEHFDLLRCDERSQEIVAEAFRRIGPMTMMEAVDILGKEAVFAPLSCQVFWRDGLLAKEGLKDRVLFSEKTLRWCREDNEQGHLWRLVYLMQHSGIETLNRLRQQDENGLIFSAEFQNVERLGHGLGLEATADVSEGFYLIDFRPQVNNVDYGTRKAVLPDSALVQALAITRRSLKGQGRLSYRLKGPDVPWQAGLTVTVDNGVLNFSAVDEVHETAGRAIGRVVEFKTFKGL